MGDIWEWDLSQQFFADQYNSEQINLYINWITTKFQNLLDIFKAYDINLCLFTISDTHTAICRV